MYYTDGVIGKPYDMCGMMCGMPDMFPEGSDVPLPPNPLLEEHALHGSTHATNETIKINDKMSINLVGDCKFHRKRVNLMFIILGAHAVQRVW